MLLLLLACPPPSPVDTSVGGDHGPVAAGVSGELGAPVPYATPEQLETFERGRRVATRVFSRSEGLGPSFNIASCAGCHERPVTGGSAGLYRNFFLAGTVTDDGAFFPVDVGGKSSGVVRMYSTGEPDRPAVPEVDVIAQRNPIPFFGVGLLAEISEEEILSRADPDDADGDGVSGRPNYDRGFVGRFGRKAQTVSIEGFIRGPLFNHLGLTTDPLSDEQKAALPVDSSSSSDSGLGLWVHGGRPSWAQAAAPDGPLTDDDGVPDPELSTDDLFDLVSFAMLLAAPELDADTESTRLGQQLFDEVGCDSCHTPRLQSPRGPLPVYSDLLLHDMGPELADGLVQGEALGAEFRTQPLWGLAAVGPYLHDGRAGTLEQAILAHGGEGQGARDAYAALGPDERACLEDFLLSLGGASQASPGLLPPDAPVPQAGEWGGPLEGLSPEQLARFEEGRHLFDREFGFHEGTGAPRFNGDSCRACHFQPVLGGSGPPGVDVMRHGLLVDGVFATPAVGTVLHKETALYDSVNRPQAEANVFERRQTPHLFGLGLLESIGEDTLRALADPLDVDGDGISGRLAITLGGQVGRFGWKAQVPSLHEFARDALSTEIGLTLPYQAGLLFGLLQDDDPVPDPEVDLDTVALLADFLAMMGPPPRGEEVPGGEALFEQIGCDSCHATPDGVPAYTDLLLHDLGVEQGIEEVSAGMGEFRTAPLWGVGSTPPYLHDGSADTLTEAIQGHGGEGEAARDAFAALDPEDQQRLLLWLSSL